MDRKTAHGEELCSGCLCEPDEILPRRRTFLQWIGLAAAAVLWPVKAWSKKLALKLDLAPQLKKVGGWAVLKLKGREILFIRDGASSIKALDPFCTHKKTILAYNPDKKIVQCAAHGSQFNLQGKVLKGPAEQTLHPVYKAELDQAKDRIIVEMD